MAGWNLCAGWIEYWTPTVECCSCMLYFNFQALCLGRILLYSRVTRVEKEMEFASVVLV